MPAVRSQQKIFTHAMSKKAHLSQQALQDLLLPLLEERGRVYRKNTYVLARRAEGGEVVETLTADGKETVNVAEPGDYIVKNQTEAEEEYILSPEKFRERYVLVHPPEGEYAEYRAVGKVMALEVTPDLLAYLGQDDTFYFEAPWGGEMIVRTGDFLATPPDKSEVYRIARKEFLETYGGDD